MLRMQAVNGTTVLHLDVVLDVVVKQAAEGGDFVRSDVKAHHSGNLLPVALVKASIADGGDEGQQLLEGGDLGLALLCNLGWCLHDWLCCKCLQAQH